MKIEFLSSSKSQTSPHGKLSYPRWQFHERHVPWSPDWSKPVLFSSESLTSNSLRLAHTIYGENEPTKFKNNPTVLLFEEPNCFRIIRSDYFTRLLFTEQEYLKKPFELEPGNMASMESILTTKRSPSDSFWKWAGLPGIPLAVGVNGSLRSLNDSVELLAFKTKDSSGEMGETVGPPLSGAANLSKFSNTDTRMTLGSLIACAFAQVIARELPGLPAPIFRRHKSWLDMGRGNKPEIHYSCHVPKGEIGLYADILKEVHAGVLILSGHLNPQGVLTKEAEADLAQWGLNFQAWFCWE